jgi:hypothetical protein
LHVRILKRLQAGFVELRILKELQADNFGQNRAKRGTCLELRILKELVVAGGRGGLGRIMKNYSIEEVICQ